MDADRKALRRPRESMIGRRAALGLCGAAGMAAGGALVARMWRAKDISARLFNPFTPANFELPPVDGLTDVDGRPVSGFASKDLAGKRSVLNVWASWCPGCRAEHGFLMALAARQLAPIFGADVRDPPERARYFLAKHGNPFNAVGADSYAYLQRAMGARGIPATFVIGPELSIEWSTFEPLTEETLEKELIPVLTRRA